MSIGKLIRQYRQIINPPYSRKDALTILATLLILISVPVTVAAIKIARSPDGKASTASGIEIGVDAYTEHIASEPSGLDYVYKYVTGQGWQSYAASYMNAAYSKGLKPVFVYYTSYDDPYSVDFVGWDQLMNTIRSDGRSAWVVVEPDTWGYLRNYNDCGVTGKQYVDRFVSTAPSNARLGFFMSPWNLPYVGAADDAADWKACWTATGANLKMEDIYVDVLDRDQQWKIAHDPGHPMAEYPWSATKFQLVEAWFQALYAQTGRKISVWQIPMGNTNSSCNGINGFRSNFVETWLTGTKLTALSPYVNRMLFGPGIEDYDQTNAQTWNLPSHRRYDCGLFNEKVMQLSTPSGDTENPTVSITSPTSGQSVSGVVTLRATADDNVGVTRVEFYYGGTDSIGTDTTAVDKSYSVDWDTTQVSNGSHSLIAKAYDTAGNVGTSSPVAVMVNNPTCARANPTVNLTPTSQNGVVGAALNYTFSVTNNDSLACGISTFSLSGIIPSGWLSTLTPSSLTLAPGANGTSTFRVTSASSASVGSYTVTAKATNSGATSYTASASATYQVASTKPGDLDGDGDVNIYDLSTLITRWGTSDAAADINDDGAVNIFDLSILLSNWGT